MSNSFRREVPPTRDQQDFENRMQGLISVFHVSQLPDVANGQRTHLLKEKKSVEGYRNIPLSDPHELANFYATLKHLPAELQPQAIKFFMKDVIERLKATAEVSLNFMTGELLLADFPIAKVEDQHLRLLSYLLSLPRLSKVTVAEVVADFYDDKTSPFKGNNNRKQLELNEVQHAFATLELFLKNIDLTAGMEGMAPAHPLRIIGAQLTQQDENGKAYKTWGYSLASDFILSDDQADEETEQAVQEVSIFSGIESLCRDLDISYEDLENNTLDAASLAKLYFGLAESSRSYSSSKDYSKITLEIEQRMLKLAKLQIDPYMATISLGGSVVCSLTIDQAQVLEILQSAPEYQPVSYLEIAEKIHLSKESTWEMLAELETELERIGSIWFSENCRFLSLNLGASQLKSQTLGAESVPHLHLTSSFKIARGA